MEPMPRLIAIGDIHGCSSALESLLDAVAPETEDVIVTLGDYIDRGPDSRGVLERLLRLDEECELRPLLGNHEVMFLSGLRRPQELHFWLACGGEATLASYGGDLEDIPGEHLDFLRRCLRYFETEEFFFVHANYDPRLPLDRQPEELLFWKHLLYGVPAEHASGKTAIVGHTPQPTGQVLDLRHLLCLDTYCFGGGYLTAMELNSGEIWQADKSGRLRE
jgi:serine/threonine protein phosphatase 1